MLAREKRKHNKKKMSSNLQNYNLDWAPLLTLDTTAWQKKYLMLRIICQVAIMAFYVLHMVVVCTCHVMPFSRPNNHSVLLLGLQGIVGNLSSGKSALVHRYLTGTYVQEESPEGKSLFEVRVKRWF